MQDKVVIVANIEDAKFLLKNKPNHKKILSLTPNVYSFLCDKNYDLVNINEINFFSPSNFFARG